MDKYLVVRIGILAAGFLLIYGYESLDSWSIPAQSIGGNSGMSIPMDFLLNVFWMALWCLFLLIELGVTLFTDNKKNRIKNLILLLSGITLLIIYIKNIQ